MAGDVLLVRVRPWETRVALVDRNGRLQDFQLYRDRVTGAAGDVFLGRVRAVSTALDAAFVDIGQDRDGFLGLAEARPRPHAGPDASRDRISDHVHEGQAVLVQVLAEARADKGAKLTRRVNVAGGHCVLTPGDPGVRISKRVADETERGRLRALVSPLLATKEGVVVRSAAQHITEAALKEELAVLRTRWDAMETRAAHETPPRLLSGETGFAMRFLLDRGWRDVARVVVDDGAAARALEAELTRAVLALPGGVRRHGGGGGDIFAAHGVADELAALLD
ncbi:MAG: ribonuclease E/G, partial [Alphaproteobacteria bacterium]|nr:ribonuclease E/G [Alphaproteobacteria bacterium]